MPKTPKIFVDPWVDEVVREKSMQLLLKTAEKILEHKKCGASPRKRLIFCKNRKYVIYILTILYIYIYLHLFYKENCLYILIFVYYLQGNGSNRGSQSIRFMAMISIFWSKVKLDLDHHNGKLWYWLVVWNIFYFSIHWEFHHPNWLSYFSEG